jgi:hypothetical protein
MKKTEGSYNDGYADNISLVLSQVQAPGPPPMNLTRPHVEGIPKANEALNCTGDTWSPSNVFTQAEWYETEIVPINGKPQSVTTHFASGRTATLPDFQPNADVYCAVTATGQTEARSDPVAVQVVRPALGLTTAFVGGRVRLVPASPKIDASVGTGGTNTCTTGTWDHWPETYNYAWYVVPGFGSPPSDGKKVGDGATHKIGAADENGYVVCVVTARNAAGSNTAESNRYWVAEPDLGFHADGIEVTQGIQTSEVPTRTADSRFVKYNGVPLPWSNGQPVTVRLAEGHWTVVRVYVSSAKPVGTHAMPAMKLSAFRSPSGEFIGSLEPDQPPTAAADHLSSGFDVDPAWRTDSAGAYTFTLPEAWASGDVHLIASFDPCGLGCPQGTIDLAPVHFSKVTSVQLAPIALFVKGRYGRRLRCCNPTGSPNSDPAWWNVQAVTPFPIWVPPYIAFADATNAISASVPNDSEKTYSLELANLGAIMQANLPGGSDYPYGVLPNPAAYVPISPKFSGGVTAGGYSLASENRALTALAHEFGHGIGRVHAGVECGGGEDAQADADALPIPTFPERGFRPNPDATDDALNQKGESWPPSTTFRLAAADGLVEPGAVGLDTTSASPYQLFSATADGPFDLMSYCGTISQDVSIKSGLGAFTPWPPAHWSSVQNWNRAVGYRSPERQAAPRAPARVPRLSPPARAAAAQTLAVTAIYDVAADSALTGSVAPDTGAPTAHRADETFSLVGLNATGQVVQTAGADGSLVHADHTTPQIAIVGKLPAAEVRAVQVLRNGRVIFTAQASAHAPTLRLLPRLTTSRVGKTGTTVRWHSSDADGGQLQVTIRYSKDDSRSWHTIYAGPDLGSASIPAYLLSASRKARIRVFVSDGFNEAIATSRRFVAKGAPPMVSILSPVRGRRVLAGAALDLHGVAYDDAGKRLRGRALTWRAGRRVVGHGEIAATNSLGAGRHQLKLTARDRIGRTVTKSVPITILAAPPVVSILRAPQKISPRARSFKLRIALLAPATLSIGHRRYAVGRRPRTIKVAIRRGRKPFALVLVLRSGRYSSSRLLTVTR